MDSDYDNIAISRIHLYVYILNYPSISNINNICNTIFCRKQLYYYIVFSSINEYRR